MNKYFKTLELNRILEMLSNEAFSEDAKENALSIVPSSDISTVEVLLNETEDAFSLMSGFGSPSFSGIRNVNNSLAIASAGGSLSAGELLKIAYLLRAFRGLNSWYSHCNSVSKSLSSFFNGILENNFLETSITNAIISEEEIADKASDELYQIRRKIRAKSLSVREELDKIVRSSYYQKFLQEPIVTQRNGRFVIPVKNEFRSEVKGLVHDSSSSGATVFIEPVSVVETNNEIKVLEGKEREEISRILYELSSCVGTFEQSIRSSYENAVALDLIFAKAQLAYKMKALRPLINNDGVTVLKSARHPLIDKNKVVPINVNLGVDFDTLVITGPNTGGKTVSLKTVGLLTLMTMCGMLIPASDGSNVCVYKNILVDIGDEQSIDQNLSTFSSHIINIIKIMKTADENSLVLIDELGAGTDPTEGAALAVAIIENLRDNGAKIIATTHYAELKTYAVNTDGVVNGSCEFDIKTLKPTYKLLIGVPGRSNAFAVSQRLGIDLSVVERAKELVSEESRQLESVLANLELERANLEKEKEYAEKMYRKAQSTADKAEAERKKSEKLRENEILMARNEARKIVEDAKRKSSAFLIELEKIKKESKNANINDIARKARREIRNSLGELDDITDPVESLDFEDKDYVLPRELKVGDLVLVRSLGKAEVVALGSKITVQAGLIKTMVNKKDLRLIGEKKKEKSVSSTSFKRTVSRADSSVKPSLDLRGKTADEAIAELQIYLDKALLAGLGEVTIIHGKGTGILRKTVADELKFNKSVAEFRLGRYGEGEDGVTIVKFG